VNWFSPSVRISLSLVCIAISVFFLGLVWQLVPDYYAVKLQERKVFCEQLAIHCSFALKQDDTRVMKEIVLASVRRNPDVLSTGVRTQLGELIVDAGNHQEHWDNNQVSSTNPNHIKVPILLGNKMWGAVEMRMQPLALGGFWWMLKHPVVPFLMFFGLICFAAFYLFFRLVFRQMNVVQARVVPRRVRDTLNNLAEGVVILDKEGKIVMANEVFAVTTGQPAASLEGKKVSELSWKGKPEDGLAPENSFPWERTLLEKTSQTGTILGLDSDQNYTNILSVNSMPIVGEDGAIRGALASFDNLTMVEKKNTRLKKLLNKLQKSRAEIQRQNQQLQVLATTDPLTRCMNRRAFFARFDTCWSHSQRHSLPISCIMVDVDKFKSINDNHGHGTGDLVLQQTAATLLAITRKGELVCRYGGEEFCILMPLAGLEQAAQGAERLRKEIADRKPAGLAITVSIGVSSLHLGARSPQELIDQADKALYVAKLSGRNRVVCWNDVPTDQSFEKEKGRAEKKPEPQPVALPFHAVTALLSALSYRHPETAEHSRRVADLCRAVSHNILSQNDCFILEVAALLHDIGKLGVPDNILLKPSPLTKEEWKILRTYEKIGEEITGAIFSPELTQIIHYRHYPYQGGNAKDRVGEDLPVGARLLAIADAYDAMVNNRAYRQSRSQKEAFAELRSCAGHQFDPNLVSHFIQMLQAQELNDSARENSPSSQGVSEADLSQEKEADAEGPQDPISLERLADRLQTLAQVPGIPFMAENTLEPSDSPEPGQALVPSQ
jgi:diguanylate cyclase (GGDEF)-like protein